MNLIQTFKELVSIDSPSGEESAVSQYVIAWAEKHHFSVKKDKLGNLIIRTNSKKPAKVFFSGHLDTVEPGRGIVCVEKGGYLISNGKTILGADNKASLAGILHAVSTYDANTLPSIELVFTTEEETVMNSQFINPKMITAPIGYIFDAPFEFGGIVTAAPYLEDFSCTIQGIAAHASIPNEALSVLPVLKNIVDGIPCGYIQNNPALGTVNIGVMSMGTGVNTVPGNLEIKGEIRSFDKKIFIAKKKDIEKFFKTLKKENKKYAVDFVFKNYAAGYVHKESSALVSNAKQALENIGRKVHIMHPQSVSDANHFNSFGIPTLVIAEGTQFAHTTRERISIKDLNDISNLVSKIIANCG